MWAIQSEPLTNSRGLHCAVNLGARPASVTDVLLAWREDDDFCSLWDATLAGTLFSAFRWETPPVTVDSRAKPFEFVLLDSPGLVRRPDAEMFAEHLDAAPDAEVVVFPNLGGDAVMVVPLPRVAPSAYGHLAAFVRDAPERQRRALWKAVGEAMDQRIGAKPVWLNTAGAGVPWLHVRLDDRPKYYRFDPYKQSL